jgi:hypothetical protein
MRPKPSTGGRMMGKSLNTFQKKIFNEILLPMRAAWQPSH